MQVDKRHRMSALLAVSPAYKSDWTALVAQRKADKSAERARVAAEEAEIARERAREALLTKAATAAAKPAAAPARTSATNFGAKDPARGRRPAPELEEGKVAHRNPRRSCTDAERTKG